MKVLFTLVEKNHSFPTAVLYLILLCFTIRKEKEVLETLQIRG